MSDVYRVAIFSAPANFHAVRDVLVASLGLTTIDAMIDARLAPGVLRDRLPRDRAERLVEALAAIGLTAEALPSDQLPEMTRFEAVHHARRSDEGIAIIEYHGAQERVVPWGAVRLFSVGGIPNGNATRYVGEPSTFSGPHHTAASVSVHAPNGPVAWIVCEPVTASFSIDHAKMNYEDLGTRMCDSATSNFRVLLSDLIERAPAARCTPATLAFVNHQPSSLWTFDSAEALWRYTVLEELIRRREARSA